MFDRKSRDDITIKNIAHGEISSELVGKIIELKSQYWSYDFKNQLNWLNDNLKSDDKHLIILNENNEIIAYTNLINIEIDMESKLCAFGIGNVCVDKRYAKLGLGRLLMSYCNFYLECSKKIGVLLCKDELLSFYQKNGWVRHNSSYYLNNEIKFNNLLIYKKNRFEGKEIYINNKIFRN